MVLKLELILNWNLELVLNFNTIKLKEKNLFTRNNQIYNISSLFIFTTRREREKKGGTGKQNWFILELSTLS